MKDYIKRRKFISKTWEKLLITRSAVRFKMMNTDLRDKVIDTAILIFMKWRRSDNIPLNTYQNLTV